MANPVTRKSCIVPKCTTTTINSPEKLFFYVPMEVRMRKKWLQAIKRTAPLSDRSSVYCCEDHFDIEKDMKNHVKFKLVGGRVKLKKGTVPHKFKCQEEGDDRSDPRLENMKVEIEDTELLEPHTEFVQASYQSSIRMEDVDTSSSDFPRNDNCELFGKYIAEELRALPYLKRLVLQEKIINCFKKLI
ncbi:uncharacterized protein LOC123675629 isoform X3 [Harmonia axyridis]|uniref:uncharacterized protein LOC123675629 isoform X3 n=1 Tax=Harmonia axyridis TaxID=115357 RepID=UPI001E275717|nr:uncharacterized protein LOC123675629 isoform X3 [Harmonia axyridis]